MADIVMSNAPFPVQRSQLLASALSERALSNYSLSGSPVCQFWYRGINDTYLVTVGAARFMLRISPANWRSREQLVAEFDLLQFLDRHHISTPQPVRQKDGNFVQTLNAPEGPRHAVVFTFVPGSPPKPMTETHSHRFGQAIARFHNVTDDYPADCAGLRFELVDMIDKPLARLRPLLADHQEDLAYLDEISIGLGEAASNLTRAAPEFGICHGDVNTGNIHFEGNRWALLDFEYFGYGWRVFDIGTFFSNQIIQLGHTESTRNILDAFLSGYQSVRPLSQTELEALPSFVMLRQLWILGVGARNLPIIGLRLFQNWLFDQCMPFIRAWMKDPW